MSRIIVYFHGYKGSPDSPKVQRLKEAFPNDTVVAFPVDVNPAIAIAQVGDQIDLTLMDDLLSDEKMVFVGTSLGGWLAGKMALMYGCQAVLINPSVDPATTLGKYGVPENITKLYTPLDKFPMDWKFFFARNDEVLPNESLIYDLKLGGCDVTVSETAGHRFDGEEFEAVVKYLQHS